MCKFFFKFKEKDLKSYMDDCGGIIALSNVKVSLLFLFNSFVWIVQ